MEAGGSPGQPCSVGNSQQDNDRQNMKMTDIPADTLQTRQDEALALCAHLGLTVA